MSDGRITALINTLLPGAVKTDATPVQLISIPAALPKSGTISGQVVGAQNGQVTIQTEQGPVILQTDLNLQIGQQINLKLQTVVQNATVQLIADLSVPSGSTVKSPASPQAPNPQPVLSPSQQTTAPAPQQPVQLSPLAQQFENVDPTLADVLQAPVQTLNAKTMALPQILTQQDLENLVQTVLNLAPQQALPQTVQEGLNKLQTLLPLLNAALQIPVENPPASSSSSSVAGLPAAPTPVPESAPVLAALQQILQAGQKSPQIQNFLTDLSTHPLQLLQQIMPGQNLSPDLLQVIKDQITILQQKIAQTAQPQESVPVSPDETVAVKSSPLDMLASLAAKIKPGMIQNLLPGLPSPQPSSSETIYQPMLGMVLGQVKALPIMEKIPVLLFLISASGQNVLSLSTDPSEQPNQLPLLPGSLVLAAVDQKAPLTLLASSLNVASFSTEALQALHVSIGDSWPTLDKLWQEVLAQQVAHPAAMVALQQTIPTPTVQHLPAATLFFLAILKNNFLGNWAGEDVLHALPLAEKTALISQLGRDLQAIQNTMSDNGPVDSWRPLPLPLNMNDQLYRLQWFYRHQYDTSSDDPTVDQAQRKKRKTRFLVDVPKTKLGDVQIDGLVQEKTLDVILRTESLLQTTVQQAIRQRYHNALETTGFAGGLIFQAGRQHYIHA